VDLSHHRSKLVLRCDVHAADLILVMDAGHQRAICRGYGRMAAGGPRGDRRQGFGASYGGIDGCLGELVGLVTGAVLEP